MTRKIKDIEAGVRINAILSREAYEALGELRRATRLTGPELVERAVLTLHRLYNEQIGASRPDPLAGL